MISVPPNPDNPSAEYTGRYLMLLDQEQQGDALGAVMGVSQSDYLVHAEALDGAGPEDAVVVFDMLGVAVVPAGASGIQALTTSDMAANGILAIEPEQYVYALGAPVGVGSDYLRGYQDGVAGLVSKMTDASRDSARTSAAVAATFNETQATWGLQVTETLASRFTGEGVRVAVLDTGIDQQHPDFVGRNLQAASFVPGQGPQDGHGHGTHCVGTACGPLNPGRLPRYGVAYEADIYVGKVLDDSGRGTDTQILAGIEWALRNHCDVISMSLGAPTAPGDSYSLIYEQVALRALAAGTLIIAAAGNDSRRPIRTAPVSRPANSPSIMAVAALEQDLTPASFSNAGINPSGGQVDIAAPGRDVHSSYRQPDRYRRLSGTSMATPHVAGIAALYAQANPGVRGGALGWLVVGNAKRLSSPATDVGAGIVQAPI